MVIETASPANILNASPSARAQKDAQACPNSCAGPRMRWRHRGSNSEAEPDPLIDHGMDVARQDRAADRQQNKARVRDFREYIAAMH